MTTGKAGARFLVLLLVLVGGARASTAFALEGASPDDNARILAGLPTAEGSPLAGLTTDPGWQAHARSFNAAWANLEQRQLGRIRAWSAANITSPQPAAFYMFSGPDFLYADAFLPNHATYVLTGLEPVGSVPQITEASRRSLGSSLAALRSSLGTVLNYSFFITKKMKTSLTSHTFKGTLPVLYVFLARSGKRIEEASLVSLDAEGQVVAADAPGASNTAAGARIIFSGVDGAKRTLYYFRTDISDHGLKGSGFAKFAAGLGKVDSFVKSASYLMHSDSFSQIRNIILTQSQTLVQDDSGVPVRFFAPGEWTLRPFGRYLGPIREFPGRGQLQLAEVFRKDGATRIDFGVGYRWRPNESNLLLATRKAP
jgi:hypothetical protein